jgi:hypothetical protein
MLLRRQDDLWSIGRLVEAGRGLEGRVGELLLRGQGTYDVA